jgi:hypothetical protein
MEKGNLGNEGRGNICTTVDITYCNDVNWIHAAHDMGK